MAHSKQIAALLRAPLAPAALKNVSGGHGPVQAVTQPPRSAHPALPASGPTSR